MHSIERFKHAELELLSFYINSFPHNIDEIKSDLNNVEFLDEKHKLIKDFLDNIVNKEITSEEIINQLFLLKLDSLQALYEPPFQVPCAKAATI